MGSRPEAGALKQSKGDPMRFFSGWLYRRGSYFYSL